MSSLPNGTSARGNPLCRICVGLFLALSLCLAAVFSGSACTVFSDSNHTEAFAGRNWDMTDAAVGVPVMWVVPAEGSAHGRICFGRDGDCEDGMNDQGLFVAVAATPPDGEFKSLQRPVQCPAALDHILAQCATVDEAISWWEKQSNPAINSIISWTRVGFIKSAYRNSGVGGHILMADKRGDSVVCEWEKGKLKIFRKTGRYQLITNFLLSKRELTSCSCPRFDAASKILAGEGQPSLAACVAGLKATSGKSTRYSVVYDLSRRDAHVYRRSRFEEPKTIHLRDALQKGAHKVSLEAWFATDARPIRD